MTSSYKSLSYKESKYRYEIKFVIPNELYRDLILFLKFNKKIFRESYDARIINSLYFDDCDFSSFYDSASGSTNRWKVRLRWYGNKKFVSPQAEVKIKKGNVGKKNIYQAPNLNLNYPLKRSYISSLLDRNKLKNYLPNIEKYSFPTLFCMYSRQYFISEDSLTRITIDRDLSYGQVSIGKSIKNRNLLKDNLVIAEIKFDSSSNINFLKKSLLIPFHQKRFSKYSNGIYKIYNY